MTRARPHVSLTIAPVALLAGFSLFWFSDTIADPDLWGHVRFGQDIIRTGAVPATDVYSYRTSGQRWINHEWLSEIIFAGLYDRLGPPGLVGFKVMLSLLLVGLSYAYLRRRGAGPYGSAFLLILMSIPFRMGLGTVRPQVFTYLCFFVVLLILEKATTASRRWLWPLPVLLAIWVNLHGGVLAGVGAIGIWIGVRVIARARLDSISIKRRLGSMLHLGLIGLACAGALLLNPYGAELILFLLRTATVARPEIREWVPLALESLPGQIYLGLLAIGAWGLVGSRRHRAPELIVIFIVAAALPLVSNRHYPLFALAVVAVGGEHIADSWNRWSGPSWTRPGQSRPVAALGVLVSLLLIALSIPRLACIRVEPFYFGYPARAVALLKQSGVSGNMAVTFDWGEYVLWHLGPRIQVSMDGRRETVYSDETYRQSRDFERGTGVWNALLKTSKTDLVLTSNGSPTANLLERTSGWVPLYQDTFCLVFTREGHVNVAQIATIEVPDLPDNGGGLCFPAPAPLRHGAAGPSLTR